jgi:hypothetical protein
LDISAPRQDAPNDIERNTVSRWYNWASPSEARQIKLAAIFSLDEISRMKQILDVASPS